MGVERERGKAGLMKNMRPVGWSHVRDRGHRLKEQWAGFISK
jgi:hypothetical protein